jgi:RHS repeat-associated protein
VTDINYNARGQRESIAYANGVTTHYSYDAQTFRLSSLDTIRDSDNKRLQNLFYVYDPVGNITGIRDNAQQDVYFNNAVVEPHNHYEYDALYRLTRADGREHAGQLANTQRDQNEFPYMNIPHPNNGQAMRRYTEEYAYDAVGNIMRMVHSLGSLPSPGQGVWSRHYQYAIHSNRLLSTSRPGDSVKPEYSDTEPYSDIYGYDDHGNMDSMPHLVWMKWDHDDQLQATTKQVVNNGSEPKITWYAYDASGERVRKVTDHQPAGSNGPIRQRERIYLGGFEIYREYNGVGDSVNLERQTLHIMDDEVRIAMVETKTEDSSVASLIPEPVTRYQINNHLVSSSIELDEVGGTVISYEEYYPYGNTSYHATKSGVSKKRYRYAGKEKDDETELSYHRARYYVSWLGRWVSADPIGMKGGLNLFNYVKNNPVRLVDYDGKDPKDYAKQRQLAQKNIAEFNKFWKIALSHEQAYKDTYFFASLGLWGGIISFTPHAIVIGVIGRIYAKGIVTGRLRDALNAINSARLSYNYIKHKMKTKYETIKAKIMKEYWKENNPVIDRYNNAQGNYLYARDQVKFYHSLLASQKSELRKEYQAMRASDYMSHKRIRYLSNNICELNESLEQHLGDERYYRSKIEKIETEQARIEAKYQSRLDAAKRDYNRAISGLPKKLRWRNWAY